MCGIHHHGPARRLAGGRGRDGAGRLGAVCIVLTSGIPGVVLGWAGWETAMPVTTAVSWLPLWIATLMAVRSPLEQSASR